MRWCFQQCPVAHVLSFLQNWTCCSFKELSWKMQLSPVLSSCTIQLACFLAVRDGRWRENTSKLTRTTYPHPCETSPVRSSMCSALRRFLCSWADPLMAFLKGEHSGTLWSSTDPRFLFQLLELKLPSGEAVLAQAQASTKVSFGVQLWWHPNPSVCATETNPGVSHRCSCGQMEGGRGHAGYFMGSSCSQCLRDS